MLVEFFVDSFLTCFEALFKGLVFTGLPLDYITVLASVFKYGSWIIGSDLLVIFFTFLFVIMNVRIGAALLFKFWDMLPF